ncbi:MAG: hypothetical protein D3905_02925 [Candidatus Electrothrix sp. AS4_5]|nr:hypothetical protein [Candidatus Electrothrix gigas]
MKDMREHPTLLCVATEKGYAVLRAVNEKFPDIQLHVCTFKEVKVAKSYYEDICAYANKHNIPLHSWKEIHEQGTIWLSEKNIFSMVCVGWRYLIPLEMIEHLEGRLLVTHDSLLPRYRGFAPLASAFINGEKEVGVTVMLVASEELDTGDIVYQGKVEIDLKDTIGTLTKKILPLFSEGIVSSLKKMFSGNLVGFSQDHSKATFSIWRDEEDLWINWNDSAKQINRIIRALGSPYMGARTHFGEKTVIIQQAIEMPDIQFEIRQPGKVWSLTSAGEPLVISGKGMLLLCKATIDDTPMIPMKNLRVRFK